MIFGLTLNWNGADKLNKLQPGLLKNFENIKVPYKWLIRDNGSKDNSCELINSWNFAEIMALDHNRHNFSQGMNSLVHHLMKDNTYNKFSEINCDAYKDCYLLLLNNDVQFNDNFSLLNMYNLIKNREDVSAIGARLMYPNSNKLAHAGVIFSTRYGNKPYHYRHQEESDQNAEKNRYFQAVTAAVCLVRLSDFLKVDGFNEKYHWCFEDIDLMLKFNKILNKKIIYCGETFIYHEESASLKKNPVNKMFLPQNVSLFESNWKGKYDIDHDFYLKDQNYNLV